MQKTRSRDRFASLLAGRAAVVAIVGFMALGGCAMSETQERVASGAAIGAVAGAAIGTSRKDAAIGAAVGAASGYLYDRHRKSQDAHAENARLQAENERLRREAEER